ncbi:helix-turn-helix transcriptional regulator [Mycobacteroides abscessus]|uniref:helix-turn-helix transcriptional regulator n=1 Tax=Mycobacteroides abscessus TaxID=36809 RepID=UPI000929D0D9|nr:helix-turn-helix transcriptional regulator [Mycobacteroides abscessus]MBN7456298.1 helix-turn-helix transcriptional regulator [Mycobacteroides abscessus subsp. abscessus]MBN7543795.1 helix-turn-helix transcriptional regulator [Mycobacteroides abscessus subsp. abscessus]MBN7569166.1 helix-turn-helix transcriptional regulator [Mycobacteroides abscessus subsp. abscessus]MDO3216685.1 helix-turn-helix transcriptional regulator [Mycobacteroides abscessus subsp. abscessus]QSM94677.1 helix-turn-hel
MTTFDCVCQPKLVMVPIMERSERAEYLRGKLKAERAQRNWSQADVAKLLSANGFQMYPTTIAKIEAGDRAVKIEEAIALADLFDITLDALTGRNYERTGQVSEMGALSATAEKLMPELASARDQLVNAAERLEGQRNRELFDSHLDDIRDREREASQSGVAVVEGALDDIPLEDWRALLVGYFARSAIGLLAAAGDRLGQAVAAKNLDPGGLAESVFDIDRALDYGYVDKPYLFGDALKSLRDKWKATAHVAEA